jgi:hypothetical protein
MRKSIMGLLVGVGLVCAGCAPYGYHEERPVVYDEYVENGPYHRHHHHYKHHHKHYGKKVSQRNQMQDNTQPPAPKNQMQENRQQPAAKSTKKPTYYNTRHTPSSTKTSYQGSQTTDNGIGRDHK